MACHIPTALFIFLVGNKIIVHFTIDGILNLMSGEVNGNPLQHSCLENSMDRGAWLTVHGVLPQDWATNTFTFNCLSGSWKPKILNLVLNTKQEVDEIHKNKYSIASDIRFQTGASNLRQKINKLLTQNQRPLLRTQTNYLSQVVFYN